MQAAIQKERQRKTPILTGLKKQGIDVFLFFGELSAVNRNGGPISGEIANQIHEKKATIITEIKFLTAPGETISFDVFLEDQ